MRLNTLSKWAIVTLSFISISCTGKFESAAAPKEGVGFESSADRIVQMALSSIAGFTDNSFTLENFTLYFDAVPSQNLSDIVIGLSQNAADDYTDLATAVRFNPAGNIDARNGSGYAALTTVPYTSGGPYRFEMKVNIPLHTYSVWVTPAGGARLQIAQNYAFRSQQATVSSLGNMGLYGNPGTVKVTNISIALTLPDMGNAPAPAPAPNPSTLSHGRDLTRAMVGPSAIGIASFANSGSMSISSANGTTIKQINSTSTYDGYTVNGAHLLVQGLSISGSIDVYSTSLPVVIRGCKVRAPGNWSIYIRSGAAKTYVLYSDLGGTVGGKSEVGILTGNLGGNILARNYISEMSDGFSIGAQNDNILENYLENFSNSNGAHNDGLQAPGNNNGMLIARNKCLLQYSQTGCINLGTWGGGLAQYVTIDSNYFAGGGYTFYGGKGSTAGISHHIVVTNNIFGRDFFPNIGYWGPVAYWETGTGSVWSNNRDTNGNLITP